MNSYYISANDPKVQSVCRAAFPDYHGTKCEIVFTTDSVDMSSYWDGGSRSYFAVVRLGDNQNIHVPAQSAYDKRLPGCEAFTIPAGFVVVEHVIFCGKDLGLRIYARPDGSNLLPEQKAELSDLEAHVLMATAALKASYGGVSDCRKVRLMEKYNYSSQAIDAARETLKAKGLLDKRGAITTNGRNAISNRPDRYTSF